VLAACDGTSSSTGTEPPMTGVFVARSVDGRAMPAMTDSVPLTRGEGYVLYRLAQASLEFLDGENARLILGQETETGTYGVVAARCVEATVPYRRQGERIVLVVEPKLMFQEGPLRLDTLHMQGEGLEQTMLAPTRKPVRVQYARVSQRPAGC
jgi:hypothetical protein